MKKVAIIYHVVVILFQIIFPMVLLWLPYDYFDHGQSLCVSVLFFDTQCPGCGLTRASMRLLHLDFAGAWQYNKLVFIVLPMVCYLWFDWFKTEIRTLDRLLERKISKKITGKFFLFDKLNIFGTKV